MTVMAAGLDPAIHEMKSGREAAFFSETKGEVPS
jgi:hypothetical protein